MKQARDAFSIKNYIKRRKQEEFKEDEFTLFTSKDGMIIPDATIIDSYFYLFDKYTSTIDVEELYDKYRYQPRILSLDLYENENFDWLLMRINKCQSVMDFDFKYINIIGEETLFSLLNEIVNLEKAKKDKNIVFIEQTN